MSDFSFMRWIFVEFPLCAGPWGRSVGKPNYSANLSPLSSAVAREQERGCLAQHGSPARSRAPARCAVNIAWARGGKCAAGLLRAPSSWCRGEMQSLSFLLLSVPETPLPAGKALKERRETGDQGSDSPSGHQVFFYPLFLPNSPRGSPFPNSALKNAGKTPWGLILSHQQAGKLGRRKSRRGRLAL